MTEQTTLTLTADRRRLEDRVRSLVDDDEPVLPDVQYRAALYDMALQNLLDTIQNHREYDGDPQLAKAFGTSVVRPHYRTSVEVKRP